MRTLDDDIFEMFRDLILEVPEAEHAVRDYVGARRRRLMAEAAGRAEARSRETDEILRRRDAGLD